EMRSAPGHARLRRQGRRVRADRRRGGQGVQRLLLASLPALVLDAHDFNAWTRAAQDEAIDDGVVGARDNQQAISGPIRYLPAQAGVLLRVIDGALDGRDNGMGV